MSDAQPIMNVDLIIISWYNLTKYSLQKTTNIIENNSPWQNHANLQFPKFAEKSKWTFSVSIWICFKIIVLWKTQIKQKQFVYSCNSCKKQSVTVTDKQTDWADDWLSNDWKLQQLKSKVNGVNLQTTSITMFFNIPHSGRLSVQSVSYNLKLVVRPVTKMLPTCLTHTHMHTNNR